MALTKQQKFTALFHSRRFYAIILGILLALSHQYLDVIPDKETLLMVEALIGTWVVGDSLNKTTAPK